MKWLTNMNARQKAGIGMLISGALTTGVGAVTYATTQDPAWLKLALGVLGFLLPAIGLTVNLPSNTEGK